jgi:hypothetical protein
MDARGTATASRARPWMPSEKTATDVGAWAMVTIAAVPIALTGTTDQTHPVERWPIRSWAPTVANPPRSMATDRIRSVPVDWTNREP